jgi:hypothetical protein
LFFAQAVGRFVRARRRGETASVFLPSVPTLLQLAGHMELERDHALDRPRRPDDDLWAPEDALVAAANRADAGGAGQDALAFEALEAQAEFDHVLFDGGEFGTAALVGSEEEQDFLGLPGLLEPDQVATLLRQRQAAQQKVRRSRVAAAAEEVPPEPVVSHREVAALRKELHQLVGAWARRTGQPHATVHSALRSSCGGPPVPQASAHQVRERIDTLRRWFVGQK